MLDNMPPAAHVGTHGAAWACNRAARRDPMIADWIVTAPSYHHLVHTCHIALIHLRSVPGQPAPAIAVPGATHELWVMAFDRAAPRHAIAHGHTLPGDHYCAQIFAAQLIARDDETADARIAATIALIVNGDLNPVDQPQWVELFGDAMFVNADA